MRRYVIIQGIVKEVQIKDNLGGADKCQIRSTETPKTS